MTDDLLETGALREDGGYLEGSLAITVDQPPPLVWRALTCADRLADWLAPGSIEQRLGGAVRIDFDNSGERIASRLTAFEPERLLEYSWSADGGVQRPVRWVLETCDGGTRVVLTLRIPASEDVARAFAGWAAHLEMLAATLAGACVRFPTERFREIRQAYARELAAA